MMGLIILHGFLFAGFSTTSKRSTAWLVSLHLFQHNCFCLVVAPCRFNGKSSYKPEVHSTYVSLLLTQGFSIAQQNVWKDAGLRYALNKAQNEGKPYTAVVIMAGTNDIDSFSARQIVDNLMILHKACRTAGAVSVACAIPKHGAIVCNEFKSKMPASQRTELDNKVDQVNILLRKRVQAANEAAIKETGNPSAGWIAFVDPHSEVIKKAGSKRAQTYAGFPTLAQYSKAMRQPMGGENGNLPIHETETGKKLKRQQPNLFEQLEDALHFSEKGSHNFAEELVDLCKSHLVRVA
jgi:lysophospholipase L1-like esterase